MRINWRTVVLSALAGLLTAVLAAQAQVPGVNSTLQSVFTLAYDNSTMKQTFSSSAILTVPTGTGGEICNISGSATKNVRVRRVIISGSTSAVMTDPVAFVKRSTATTGGAGNQPAVVPYDSANSAGTAIAEIFTTYGTVGTLVGVLADIQMRWGNITTGLGETTTYVFGELGQPLVLRGIAQQLAVNLGGNSFGANAVFSCTFEWTEE